MRTMSDCKAAAKALKGRFRYKYNWGTLPKRCFASGGNFYFNSNSRGRAHGYYSPLCKVQRHEVNGCPEVSAEEMAKRDQLTVQADIIKCSHELGRTQSAVNTMYDITVYLTRIHRISQIIKNISTKIARVSSKVSTMLSGVPIIGQIASVVDKIIQFVRVVSTIVEKIFKALKKLKKPVGKVKTGVDNAKNAVDDFKAKTDLFYNSLDQIYVCKNCVLRTAAQAGIEKFNTVVLAGKNPLNVCHTVLKPINDGPMKLWEEIKKVMDKLKKVLDPVIALIEKVGELVNKVANEVAKKLKEMKCCLPALVQMAINAAASVFAVALCPLWGALDGLIKTLSDAVTAALFKLLKKIIPRVNIQVGGWSWNSHLTMSVSAMPQCGLAASININKNFGFAGISFDTNTLFSMGNSEGDLGNVKNNINSAINQRCKAAFSSFNKVFEVCECKIPVIGPIINVINAPIKAIGGLFSGRRRRGWRL